MATVLHLATIFAMLMCPILVSGTSCSSSYPNPNNLTINGNVEIVDHLFQIRDGLNSQRMRMGAFYLPSRVRTGPIYRNLLISLVDLFDYERRIQAAYTSAEGQNDAELIVLRSIFNLLVNNTCNVIAHIFNIDNCDYMELKKLKVKLDVYNTSLKVKEMVDSTITDYGLNLTAPQSREWYQNVFQCSQSGR